MRNGFGKIAAALMMGAALCGCRFKGGESFMSATTPSDYPLGEAEWNGDPYAKGSIAEASGGTKVDTTYGAGARRQASAPLNASFDQPAKGAGQQPGEYNNEAAGGFAKTNAPGLQPQPSDVNSLSSRAGQ